ncbi:hypothetical protein [Desulfovibrio sp. QI0442]
MRESVARSPVSFLIVSNLRSAISATRWTRCDREYSASSIATDKRSERQCNATSNENNAATGSDKDQSKNIARVGRSSICVLSSPNNDFIYKKPYSQAIFPCVCRKENYLQHLHQFMRVWQPQNVTIAHKIL